MSISSAMSEWETWKFSSHNFLRTPWCVIELRVVYLICQQIKTTYESHAKVSSAKSTRKQTIFENVEGLKVLGLPYLHSEIWSDKCHAKRMHVYIQTFVRILYEFNTLNVNFAFVDATRKMYIKQKIKWRMKRHSNAMMAHAHIQKTTRLNWIYRLTLQLCRRFCFSFFFLLFQYRMWMYRCLELTDSIIFQWHKCSRQLICIHTDPFVHVHVQHVKLSFG